MKKENRSNDLSQLRITSRVKVEVVCICGKTFEAWPIGQFTRRYCNECVESRAETLAQAERAAEAAQIEASYRELIARARIPKLWRGTTFETSDESLNPQAFQHALAYANTFNDLRTPASLMLWSRGNGPGKTHLAACIANYVLHELRRPVVFKAARDLLLELRRTFSERGELSEIDVLERVLSVDLLVLDDVGLDPSSEWVWATYWTIFNKRLENELPVVITAARYPMETVGREIGLAERIGTGAHSRLRQLCRGDFIDVSGPDLR